MSRHDVVVIGAGPNGLACAVALARAGRSVLLLEANDTVGGAARSAELTLPGFVHDPFSGVHPLGIGSPFFETLPLHEHGLTWVQPPVPLAHPFDRRPAALLERSLEATAATLGADGAAWKRLLGPTVRHWHTLVPELLAPVHLPRHPLRLAQFAFQAIRSARDLALSWFGDDAARALFAGSAAHAGLPLHRLASASFGLVLSAAGHAVGWPMPRGGAGRITQALAAYFRSMGGEIRTGVRVRSLGDVPPARAVVFNLTPRQILSVAGDRLPTGYRHALQRFRYGAGVFKVDWALAGPVPWTDPACARAGTVHLSGSYEELAKSERHPLQGTHSERPFVLFAQPSLFDPTRAPAGRHTAWGYCHVPNGSTEDMTDRIEAQVERFAPGFRDLILARHVMTPVELERQDANLVGGDVNGGAPFLGQLFFRPALKLDPYRIPGRKWFVCSASTPPGGAVHGMCGYHAAQSVLRAWF